MDRYHVALVLIVVLLLSYFYFSPPQEIFLNFKVGGTGQPHLLISEKKLDVLINDKGDYSFPGTHDRKVLFRMQGVNISNIPVNTKIKGVGRSNYSVIGIN